MSKGFFGKWREGMSDYRSSVSGQLAMKKWFMRVVIVGLFGGGVQQIVNGGYFMSLVLIGFGCIMVIDYGNIISQLKNIERLR